MFVFKGLPFRLRCGDPHHMSLEEGVSVFTQKAGIEFVFPQSACPPPETFSAFRALHYLLDQNAKTCQFCSLAFPRIRLMICHVSSFSHASIMALSSADKSSSLGIPLSLSLCLCSEFIPRKHVYRPPTSTHQWPDTAKKAASNQTKPINLAKFPRRRLFMLNVTMSN